MYEPPFQQPLDQRTYYSTSTDISPTFNDFTALKAKLVASANPPKFIENEKRAEIVKYYVDNRRAFNYSKDPRRYRPYDIAKDAYDYNFYNYGFQMKDI